MSEALTPELAAAAAQLGAALAIFQNQLDIYKALQKEVEG